MNINILERADIPTNDYNAEKTSFSSKYFMDDNLSNLNKPDNINKFRHNGLDTSVTSVSSEHEPLFYSKNMIDNSQQGDAIATIMKNNLWVPANKHPQIAPAEFANWIKQHGDEKPEKIKTKSKLRRKKSHLSSVSYPFTESDNTSSTQQSPPIEESKHRNTQKSLLRRQVVHARKKGQRGSSVSAENTLHDIKASANQESQDQLHVNTKNTNGQSPVTHVDGNETQIPTQQVPTPRLPISDIFPKTEAKSARTVEDIGTSHMCAQKEPSKKTWSFRNLFKKSNKTPDTSSLVRFFSKALPNNRQKSLLRRKRSSSVKKKKKMTSTSCRNSFSFIDSERLPLYVERAIYHLSHVKLSNTKRPLCQQVVISNMMYTYLATSRNQSDCTTTPPRLEPNNHYPDRFEPPGHHTEEGFPDDDDDNDDDDDDDDEPLKKDSKKQKKKKYKPVQNKQYNSRVV